MITTTIFLDESSAHVGEISRERAEQSAKLLVSTLKALRKVNKKIVLNTAGSVSRAKVSTDWTLQSIFGGTAFKEEWDFLRLLNDRSPLSAGLSENLEQAVLDMEVCSVNGDVRSWALAWAFLLDSATVSFDGHLDWNYPWVDAKFVDLDDDANLVERQEKVRNFSKNEHVDQHAEWLKSLGYNEPLSADLVWKEREDRFPGLRFLTRVESDLLTLDGSGMVFEQAISAIQALSNDVCNWNKDQAWPIFSRKATPEGEQRKRLCWVVDEVTEEKALFDWHVRFTGNFPGRIHFRVDVADRQIIVAYVGSKLDRDIA